MCQSSKFFCFAADLALESTISKICSNIYSRLERLAFEGGSKSWDWNLSAVRSVSTSASSVRIRSSKARFSLCKRL